MKKLLTGILCAALCGAAVLGAAACGEETAGGEPTFELAGSLQELYGEGGYPQAVLVAKSALIGDDPAAVAKMLSHMENSHDYLASAQPAKVVSDLAACYPADLTPSFNANNLNAQVIANCSVKFEAALSAKERVKSYLADVGVQAVPADAFFYGGGAAEGTLSSTYTVYAPDGAPALALAGAIADGDTHFEYHVVKADTIAAHVSNTDPAKNADFCVLPSNAAAQKLGSGEAYKLLGVVTNGNMYFIRSNTALSKLNKDTLGELTGKRVGVVQLNNVPGLTFEAVLKKANIAYQVLNSDAAPAADKVNLVAIADAKDVGPGGGCDYYLCPEPMLTLKVSSFAAQNK